MNFVDTPIPGVVLIEADRLDDERGYFARVYCEQAFLGAGLPVIWPQCSSAWNRLKGTLRGLHFQDPPHQEAKLVRCSAGSLFDIVVDLRPEYPTYRAWWGVELSRRNLRTLFVPEGLAHGYQTLEDDSEVHYMISAPHISGVSRGLRWDDPMLGIQWPLPDPVLSAKDRSWPGLEAWEERRTNGGGERHG